ncbi:nitroreductase family protein [Streptomyces sp. NPDC048718]|uniref:nitroreductase family protein n=1 Tax=Streptomyces sp. NPDC048718 TaxID=3365587 RepID=UPI00371EA9D2
MATSLASSSAALQVIRTRSVVRQFTAEPVDDDRLDTLLDAMLAAPTGGNKQAWAFVAVREPRNLRVLRAFSPGLIEPSPLVVVACFDRSRAVKDDGEFWDEGLLCVAMAVQNLLLAAHSMGLGGCPAASFRRKPVQTLLRLPEHLEPLLMVTLGYPKRDLVSPPRRDRSEVVSHEVWGNISPSGR